MASRKLRPYFQCHPISVITTFPLRNILHKQELSSRLAKWAIEFSEYDIIYQPRTAIKLLVLVDFVAYFSTNLVLGLFTDGSSNVKGVVLGIVLIPPSREVIRQPIKCYPITNNEAEYEAMIAGLELERELGIEQIVIKSDSLLVVNQMQGTYIAREKRMQQYLEKMFGGPLARCLGPSQTEYVMREVHERHWGNHIRGRSLVKKLIRAGYYWPKMEEEVENVVARYDKEALIPVEIGKPSTRYTHATEEANKEELRVNLDLLEETREATLIQMAAQKQMIERYYNRKANLRYFKIGDFVLKKVFWSTKVANAGKLSPNWEGPYRVRGIAGKRAYELETMDGKVLSLNWNAVYLKRYYF
ncbi:uncharacterized protein LOC142175924 [Nicotiana tabacum]|uniref:Uncharacterized protein LOC142175924 n=1 Tax=Nicotiana tabacum TaxID=4097 RepID=A0AC58TP85_TOBAC